VAQAFRELPRAEACTLELATQALIEEPANEAARALVAALVVDEDELRIAHERAAAGQRELARDALREALNRGEDDAVAAGIMLSGLAALAGDFAESCDAALAVLDLDSRHALALSRAERAARRLREPARMERAFDAGLRAAPGTRERSRLLVHLAVLASSRGDEITAVNRALEAIRVDPSCAEAYVLLTRRLEHIPSEGLGGVVDRARAALGDSALILRKAIEIASARGLDKLALRLREARANMSDLGGDALRARLALSAFSHDPAAPRAAIRDALEVPDVIEEALDELLAALERLLEIDPKNAGKLAMAAVDRHGEGSFVSLAHRAAQEEGDADRSIAALERVAAWGRGAAKARALVEIATWHRNTGSLAGEHRALLRLLSVSPRDAEALSRLVTLYASTGEMQRLEAVLSLSIEASEDPATRAVRGIQLARTRLAEGRDPAGAVSALERVVSEARREGATPVEALPFAGELFPLFEAAAFELADEAVVHSFYEALEASAMGRHARRGLVARRAKLLEKMGRYESALAHYGRAFAMEPVEGGILDAIARLADSLGDELAIADAWLLLAARTEDADGRVKYVSGAAEKLESAAELARACEVTLDLYRATNRLDLLPRLFDLAKKSGDARRDEIADVVVQKLEDRIDGSWDFADQLRCLSSMVDAELLRQRPDAASAAANRASELSKSEEDANQDELAALHARLAAHFDANLVNDRARHHAARAIEHQPAHAAAQAVLQKLGPPREEQADLGSALPPIPAFRAREQPAPAAEPAQGPQMDVAQTRELMGALLADPAQPAIWLVLSEAEDGGSGVRDVAAAVRAAFEHEPPPAERPFESPCPVGLPLLEDRQALVEALLRTLEGSALDLLPRSVTELGGDPEARVPTDDPRPAARVFQRLLGWTGLEGLALYIHDDIGRAGQLTTLPPGLVLSAWAERDEAKLPFIVARLIALACPGAFLVGSRFSLEELEVLLEAISLAFSGQRPADETRADVAALATRLRRELPTEAQDEITGWLFESPLPSADEVFAMVHRRAAALALLQTGTLYAAIQVLFQEEPALIAQPPRGLESLYSACKSSAALTELLTVALDPAFTAMYREHASSP
jgi:tetratricopeptide (TPR) repeat protein